MKELLDREKLIQLVRQVNTKNSEKEENDLLEKIINGVIDPDISDYIFWTDMTPEQIVDKALSYKPVQL